MTAARRLGVLGGTFDPIHFGHLDAAEAARASLELDEVLFVPAHDPPHKPGDPHASAFHRFALIALAIQEWPGYRASDMELSREGASYTADTLRALHACGWRPSNLFFIVGADAFAEIRRGVNSPRCWTWRSSPSLRGPGARSTTRSRARLTSSRACAIPRVARGTTRTERRYTWWRRGRATCRPQPSARVSPSGRPLTIWCQWRSRGTSSRTIFTER